MTRTQTTLALTTLAALGLAAALPQSASAQAAFTFNGGSVRTDASGYTLGYSFTTGSAPTVLVALGYYAPSALNDSHEVGLFTQDGTQLADAIVPAKDVGTVGDPNAYALTFTPENGFTGLLTPGTTYLIGGQQGPDGDAFIDHATSVTSPDGFTYGIPKLANPGPFAAPVLNPPTGGAYGAPNLIVAPAPEPSQTAALGVGLLGLAGLALRARKRTA